MFDFNKKEDSAIVKQINDWYDEAETARQPREEQWEDYYKLYRNYSEDTRKDDGKAHLFIPYIYSTIETVVPKIMASLFAGTPFLGVLPVKKEDVDSAKLLEALMDYMLMHKLKIKTIVSSWVKETCIYGTGIIKVGWEYETGTKVENEPILSVMGETILTEPVVNEEAVIKDQPMIQHIDLWDVYVDPLGTDIDSAKYVIHKVYRDAEYLLQMEEAGIYKNVKELINLKKEEMESNMFSGVNAYDAGNKNRMESIGIQTAPTNTDRIELYECWLDDRVIVVADRKILLRNEPNPFYHGKKPFIRLVDVLVPHEFYGIGEIEPVAHLQHEINTLRNQRLDNINIIINRMWKVLRGADIRPEDLVSRPGGIIMVDDMEDIEELQFTDVTGGSIEASISIVKKDMDNANGVFDYTRGQTTDRRETATTASILSQSATERFMLKTVNIEDMGLKRLGELIISLMKQFFTDEQVVRIMGEDGMAFSTVTPSSFSGEYDIIVRGTAIDPTLNKEARLAQFINLYNLLKDSPYVDHTALLRRILEAANIKDVDAILLSPEEQQQKMMEQMFAQEGVEAQNQVPVLTEGGVMNNGGAGMY